MFKFNHAVLSNRNHIFAGMFGIAKGAAAVTDVLATVAMCMFLSDSKSDIPRTNNLLSKLVQFTIQRGALVTLIQALLLITFYAAPSHLAWFAFHMNVTKLYANTFFAMLNARSHLRDTNANGVISGLSGGNISSFNDTHLHSQPRGLSFLQVKTSGSVKESNTHYASFSTGHNGEDGFIAAPSGKVPEVYPQSVMVLGGIIGTPGGLGKGYGRAGGKRSYDAESLDMEMDDMGGKRGAQGGVPGAPVVNVTKTVVVADR
ncbi:hypothetical protein FA15DRAFT_516131 [Coprinopsis marcescibilis]|uniref:DUF6534 domain-containing protein n=1 Tax=Coprinopsis marcescibilis TaxID=230819 RepID=A0A5C3KPV0_COPMA|nr:hypothetical protein FA15DRAFT_516131 [Coprinopsis marcescibilis]